MKNLIALGILVVLGVIALVVFRERPVEDKEKLADVIKPVSLDKLDTIKIKRMDGIGDKAKPESYTLKKKGDKWRMSEPVDYKVVQSTVESMTRTLSELRIVDVISEKKEKHGKFAVTDKGGIEVVALSGKDTLAHLILGNARNGFTFARLPKKDTVYRLKGSFRFNFDKAARMVREKEITKFDIKNLKKITFKKGEESLTFIKDGDENSDDIKPLDVEIPNFDESKAKGVVRSVGSLNTLDFMDEKQPDEKTGLGEGATKITIEATKDDKPYNATLLIGKEDEELKKTYAKVTRSDQLFLISSYTAKRLNFQASDYARTDEEMEKIKKRDEKAKKNAADKPAGPPGAGGPGGMQITPEMLKQMQQ
jgi:hypothetical protein